MGNLLSFLVPLEMAMGPRGEETVGERSSLSALLVDEANQGKGRAKSIRREFEIWQRKRSLLYTLGVGPGSVESKTGL